ncbi:hypothetical protein J3E69DRAFT_320780 [Trichoderma sp. SZMC 28015]
MPLGLFVNLGTHIYACEWRLLVLIFCDFDSSTLLLQLHDAGLGICTVTLFHYWLLSA